MSNQDKTYARVAYLKENPEKWLGINRATWGEKFFERAYGVKSENLMKKYKLTPEIIHDLEKVLDEGEMKPFTVSEIEFLENEYGEKVGEI